MTAIQTEPVLVGHIIRRNPEGRPRIVRYPLTDDLSVRVADGEETLIVSKSGTLTVEHLWGSESSLGSYVKLGISPSQEPVTFPPGTHGPLITGRVTRVGVEYPLTADLSVFVGDANLRVVSKSRLLAVVGVWGSSPLNVRIRPWPGE